MTLSEIQEATGVPASYIIEELGLPPGVEMGQRLGRLRTTHGFTVDDVRRVVQTYQQGEIRRPRRQRPRRN
jgi:hypothetical protein